MSFKNFAIFILLSICIYLNFAPSITAVTKLAIAFVNPFDLILYRCSIISVMIAITKTPNNKVEKIKRFE